MKRGCKEFFLLFFLILWASLCLPSFVQADQETEISEKISELSSSLAELKQLDSTKIATQAIEQAEIWINQARSFVISQNLKKAEMRVKEGRFQLNYIRTLIEMHEALQAAEEKEKRATEMEKEASDLKAALEQAREEFKMLKSAEEETS